MDYETLLTVQGYAKFFLILAVFIIFYSYAYSIYKTIRCGRVLDKEPVNDTPVAA